MAGGLAVVGVAGYGFVALSGHTLPAKDAAGVAALYLLINLIGPGVFSALEQETSRTVSAELATGGSILAVRRRAATVGLGLLLALLVVLAGLAPVLVPTTLGGNTGLFGALVLGTVTSGLVYLARGLLAGTRRFTGYAVTLAGEGVTRLLPCVLLALFGAASATGYAVAFALGSMFGAAAAWPWLRNLAAATPAADALPTTGAALPTTGATIPATAAAGPTAEGGPRSSAAGMTHRLLLLVGSTTMSQLLANLAPIVVAGRLTGNAPVAAAFTSAFVLARLPLTAFTPVQALMLPTLTAAAARGEVATVRRRLGLIVAAAAGVGLLGTLAAGTLGPWAVRVLFGAKVDLGWPVLTALGASTLLLMLALVLQPGLVALRQHRMAAGSWLTGALALTGLLLLPGDPLHAAIIAQLVGSALVVVGMAATLFVVVGRSSGTSAIVAQPVPMSATAVSATADQPPTA